MNAKYIFEAESGTNSCNKCQSFNGREFSSFQDAPRLPLHPNCQCTLERVEEENKEEHFDIKESVSSRYANPKDTLTIKKRLVDMGLYKVPEYGLTEYPDTQMFESLQKLQEMNGIYPNGEVRPGDKTYQLLKEGESYSVQLVFDGQKLSWYENGELKKSWKAQSGRDEFQSGNQTHIKNKGPIPEGKWFVNQVEHQNFYKSDDIVENFFAGLVGKGAWPNLMSAWGTDRIWLKPATQTDTKDRTGLTIHGGWNYGSAGCIDLAQNMDDFIQNFKKYGKDIQLIVHYPKESW